MKVLFWGPEKPANARAGGGDVNSAVSPDWGALLPPLWATRIARPFCGGSFPSLDRVENTLFLHPLRGINGERGGIVVGGYVIFFINPLRFAKAGGDPRYPRGIARGDEGLARSCRSVICGVKFSRVYAHYS